MKHVKYIFPALLFAMLMISCKKDLLNSQTLDQYSDPIVWKDSSLTVLFVNNIYAGLPSEYDTPQDFLGNYTDESTSKSSSATFTKSINFNQNLTISSTGPFAGLWGNYYAMIRQCNVFLENVGQLPASAGLKNRLTGEVRFLRALYYHYLYNYFGRFPLVTKSLGQNDNLYIPRSTDDTCVRFITDELNTAASLLPTSYPASDAGRATKGAALALQSRVFLYAGQWQNASNAASSVMALNRYSLYADYAGIFYPQNENNSEVIFDKQYIADISSNQSHNFDYYNQNPAATGVASSGNNDPSGNLVDSYEMKDGSPFSWNEPLKAAAPYANRDPRLDASIIHDGSVWLGQKVDMKRGTLFNSNTSPSTTGYYIRKFLNPAYAATNNTQAGGQNFVIIRYAEVLLNYAEAQLNLNNPEEARKYVNIIRARPSVDMPAITPADFNMERYRHERFIELAFEGLRIWDIKRWGIGPQTRGISLTGVDCKDTDGIRSYTPVIARQAGISRVWADRMYLFPIPLTEIQKYPAGSPLEQNPGW